MPDLRRGELLARLEALGLPHDLCHLDASVAEIQERTGELTWYSAISLAEAEIGGALPALLLESLATLGELFDFVEVRLGHDGER